MSLYNKSDGSELKVFRNIETQTDVSVQVRVRQYFCNVNPPALAATGVVPIISKMPMYHYFREYVILENTGSSFNLGSHLLMRSSSSNMRRENSTQTLLCGSQLFIMYKSAINNESCDPNIHGTPDCMHEPPMDQLHVMYARNSNANILLDAQDPHWAPGSIYGTDNANNFMLPSSENYQFSSDQGMGNNHGINNLMPYFRQNEFHHVGYVITPVSLVYVCQNNILWPTYIYNMGYTISQQQYYIFNNFVNVNNNPMYPNQYTLISNKLTDENNNLNQNGQFAITEGAHLPGLAQVNITNEDNNNVEAVEASNDLPQNESSSGGDTCSIPEQEETKKKICAFCRTNGESRLMYASHQLRGEMTPDGKIPIECPVLQKYKCKICGATGDNAHTESHCPQNKNRGKSTAKIVTRTSVTSSGNKRRGYNF